MPSTERSVTFVPVDPLGRLIQAVVAELEIEGKLHRGNYRPPPPQFSGYCARMCQAYKYLARDSRTRGFATAGARPRYVRISEEFGDFHKGESHYWMQAPDGIMDLNFGADETPVASYWPYQGDLRYTDAPRNANSQGFHPAKDDWRYPSRKESRLIVETLWMTLARLQVSSER